MELNFFFFPPSSLSFLSLVCLGWFHCRVKGLTKETHPGPETQVSESNSLALNPETKKHTLTLKPEPKKYTLALEPEPVKKNVLTLKLES